MTLLATSSDTGEGELIDDAMLAMLDFL